MADDRRDSAECSVSSSSSHCLLHNSTIPGNHYLLNNYNDISGDDEGHFIWPGFGDNLRVLEWIIKRCEGKADAVETPIGYVPQAEDINLEGLDFSLDTLKSILEVDKDLWRTEADGIAEFYEKFGDKLPAELKSQLATLKNNLK